MQYMRLKVFASLIFVLVLFLGFGQNIFARSGGPAASDPDINIRLRGWNPASFSTGLVDHTFAWDPKAPQLSTLIGETEIHSPSFTGFFQVKARGGSGIDPSNASLPGMGTVQATSGTALYSPKQGYDFGNGLSWVILYATPNDIVIHDTPADTVEGNGYTLHLFDIEVNPDLLKMYEDNEASGRTKLVAIPCHYLLGKVKGNGVLMTIRDTGNFMDLRFNDWWTQPVIDDCKAIGPALIDLPKHELIDLSNEVPCNETSDNELHNLRPYPANPCKKKVEDTTLLCANDLVVVKTPQDAPNGNCTAPNASGSFTCTYTNVHQTSTVSVDLSSAQLPIMGNTEDVPNQTGSSADDLTLLQRLNNYVSWYLNGTEYLPHEDDGSYLKESEVVNRAINYSGPINKLMPWAITVGQRIKQINDAVASVNSNAEIRHNQIVDCTYFGVYKPCNTVKPNILGLISHLERLISPWAGQKPPLEADFTNFQDYWKSFYQWLTSAACTPTVDFLGGKFYICAPIVKETFWGQYFTSLIMSSTEDRVGLTGVGGDRSDNAPVNPGGVIDLPSSPGITNVTFTPSATTNSVHNLYFAHMQEDAELSAALQNTFKPQGIPSLSGKNTAAKLENHCVIQEPKPVDEPKGDSLHGNIDRVTDKNVKDAQITGILDFYATYKCTFTPIAGSTELSRSCDEIHAAMAIFDKTPFVQQNWDQLVGGSMSIFKRIFPKVGPNSVLTDIKEIPAKTSLSYTSTSGDTVLAGDPKYQKSGSDAELYFPYIGGIEEYFLKGIQKALRPKPECVPSGGQANSSSNSQATLTSVGKGFLITASADPANLITSIPGEYGQRSCDWAKGKGLAYAINANFGYNSTSPIGPFGFNGNINNFDVKQYDGAARPMSLIIDKNGQASIYRWTRVGLRYNPPNLSNASFIVTGVYYSDFPDQNAVYFRTAIGLSGNTLFIRNLVATTEGVKQAMSEQGIDAEHFVMLDGDSVSQMCKANPDGTMAQVWPPLDNTDARDAGWPKAVAVSMGIKAASSSASPAGDNQCSDAEPLAGQPIPPANSGNNSGSNLQCTTLGYTLPHLNSSTSVKSADQLIADLRLVNPGGFTQSTIDKVAVVLKANYQTLITKSIAAGFNPAFVMATWLEETAAGTIGGAEFGCGDAPDHDFNAQLDCFLGLPKSWNNNKLLFSCGIGPNGSIDFQHFMLFFSEGTCNSTQVQAGQFCTNQKFPGRLIKFYNLVKG